MERNSMPFHLTLVRTRSSTRLSGQAHDHNVSQRDKTAAIVPCASEHLYIVPRIQASRLD